MMWRALQADLADVPGVALIAIDTPAAAMQSTADGVSFPAAGLYGADAGVEGRFGKGGDAAGEAPIDANIAEAILSADAVWPLALETGGGLERLSSHVLRSGRILLGSRPQALRVAGSRLRTAHLMAEAGIAVAATYAPHQPLPVLPGAWLVKPDDGASCTETRIFSSAAGARAWIRAHDASYRDFPAYDRGQRHASQRDGGQRDGGQPDVAQPDVAQRYVAQPDTAPAGMSRAPLGAAESAPSAASPLAASPLAARPLVAWPPSNKYVLQPYIAGKFGSLSLLCRDGAAQILSCNEHRIAVRDNQFHFLGTTVNSIVDSDGALGQLALAVATAMPGLWGHVGVEFVMSARGVVVLEVNARITPAYAGLRASIGCNPAALVIDLLDEPAGALFARPTVLAVSVDVAAFGEE